MKKSVDIFLRKSVKNRRNRREFTKIQGIEPIFHESSTIFLRSCLISHTCVYSRIEFLDISDEFFYTENLRALNFPNE